MVVDRIVLPKAGDEKARKDVATRLADSFETALELADGIAIAEFADKPLKASSPPPSWGRDREGGNHDGSGIPPPLTPPHKGEGKKSAKADAASGEQVRAEREDKDILRNKNETHERITFSARFACPVSGFTIEEIEPRLFSFNAPAGACPKCDGLGTEMRFEADLVVPDATLSLKKGAVYPWAKTGSTSPYYEQTLEVAGQALQGVDDDAVGEAAQEGAGRHPLRHRR